MPERGPLRSGDPERIGDYRLIGRLGQGGQGVVYLAQAGEARRAIKVLHSLLIPDSAARTRLLREVESACRVPAFCTAEIFGLGIEDGDRLYIVSEYVPGESLQTVVERNGPLSGGALNRMAVATVTALAATHQAGIVHRDFKPHNVLLGPDGPRIIDFGIAKALEDAAQVTAGSMGTPAYMAPEQLREEKIGPAADMFSWAVTMTFAATGRPAFGSAKFSVISRILHEEPDLIGVPEPLQEVVVRCLDKAPARRPSAREVWAELLSAAPVSRADVLADVGAGIEVEPLPPASPTIDRPAAAVRAARPESKKRRLTSGRGKYVIAAGALVAVIGASLTALTLRDQGSLGGSGARPPAGPPPIQITVGSADFAENALLGEIYARVLESKGVKVTRKFNIGNRETYYSQVATGAVGVIPEYNGALASHIVGLEFDESGPTDTAEINSLLRRRLPPTLEILNSADAEDKDSVTVTKQTAEQYDLRSIGDLKDVAGEFVLGGAPEFESRHQGVIGLRAKYDVNFKDFQPFRTDDYDTLVQLLKSNKINAADLFTTDPAIPENEFVVLTDPKHLFSAQNVTPLVYRPAINNTMRAALNAVSAKLTTRDLLDMNTRVSVDGQDPETVAEDWLEQAGLAG